MKTFDKIVKGTRGEYRAIGGKLDDAIFFLSPNQHMCYGVEDYKRITISYNSLLPDYPYLKARMLVDECNPIESLMIVTCNN